MARRSIGQERFGFNRAADRLMGLDELLATLDFSVPAQLLSPVYAAAKGEPAWPPLALFKALLLATWYDLSDVALAEALADRASFRRFCGFSRDEATPERTAFVRFRRMLIAYGLDRSLFETITLQLEAKGAAVRKGTLIDATIIASASKGDGEARWAKHKKKAPVHGYKAHIAADRDTGLIREVVVTPANEADVSVGPEIIPDEPGEVYGDKAYDALSVEKAILRAGGTPRILRKGQRGIPAQQFEDINRPLRPIRARVEKIFGTWKRSYRLRQMRWIGLAKAALQIHLATIAYNYKRYWRLQTS
jgi:transposase, IS5 family